MCNFSPAKGQIVPVDQHFGEFVEGVFTTEIVRYIGILNLFH